MAIDWRSLTETRLARYLFRAYIMWSICIDIIAVCGIGYLIFS
mgnify:CR=1 FL=1|jgi:hypothetical protein